MRPIVTCFLVVTAALLPGCGQGPGDSQCRTQFADYRQMMGENGNPGTAAMPRLTKKWDALYAEMGVKAKSAVSKDCTGTFDTLKKSVQGTQAALYDSNDFDMVDRLAYAEGDLKHAESLRSYDPLPAELAVAFPALRAAAPRSNASLAPQLTALDRVDPLDKDAITSATRDLKAAAKADPDYLDCLKQLNVIGEFELDEE